MHDKRRKRTEITLRNDFHGTSAKLLTMPGVPPSSLVASRVDKALCPRSDCSCGGIRGPQDADAKDWLDSIEGRFYEDYTSSIYR